MKGKYSLTEFINLLEIIDELDLTQKSIIRNILDGYAESDEIRSLISNIDKDGNQYEQKFDARIHTSLNGNRLTVIVSSEYDKEPLEFAYYLWQREVGVIQKQDYSQASSYQWDLSETGAYSAIVFIKRAGDHYKFCDKVTSPDFFFINKEKKKNVFYSIIERESVELLISMLAAKGNLVDFLKSLGFQKIAAYSNTDLGLLIFRICYYQNCFVEVFSTEKKRIYRRQSKFNCLLPFNTLTDVSKLQQLDSTTALIVCDTDNTNESEKFKSLKPQLKAKIFYLKDIVDELLFNKIYLEPLLAFAKTNKKILILNDFTVQDALELSEHEKCLCNIAHEKYYYVDFVKRHLRESGFSDPVWLDRGKEQDYILRMENPHIVLLNNGLIRLNNFTSKYTNIVNYFRVTTGNIGNRVQTVWMFGSSKIIGERSADEETIPSYLQELINIDSNIPFNVVNCASYYNSSIEQQIRLLNQLPIKDGDVCVFHIAGIQLCIEKLKQFFNVLDLRPVVKRPHPYGEIFYDQEHLNFVGNKIMAKGIFDKLLETKAFDMQSSTHHIDNKVSAHNQSCKLTPDEEDQLAIWLKNLAPLRDEVGAIVMNCNPFTLGHLHLIRYAASAVSKLFIFVVEEDKSFFPFDDRFTLVKQGVAGLQNITVLPSGKFIISQRTFAEYGTKEVMQDAVIDPSMDVELFATRIAPTLGITIRFAGEEPLDNITRQYNASMARILPSYGIKFEVIPRKELDNDVISASRVRNLLKIKDFETIAKMVPETTLSYLVRRFCPERMLLNHTRQH